MNNEHNTFAYCTSFFCSLSHIQQDDYGSGANSTKKKKRGNGINGRPEVKRINKNGRETTSINK
jgi:hypothetical protein